MPGGEQAGKSGALADQTGESGLFHGRASCRPGTGVACSTPGLQPATADGGATAPEPGSVTRSLTGPTR